MRQRFTIDGSPQLEEHLESVCRRVSAGVRAIVPVSRLQGLVLAGGYGRGEGGVLRTEEGDRPYNDLEFYVFTRGSRFFAERRFGRALGALGEELTPESGLHVEFKIESLGRLRRTPVSMFSYDLVVRNRILLGGSGLFVGCEHHLDRTSIPLADATRLLFNRCSGLLLAREMLASPQLTTEQADFIGRNIAKAQLALGDALLTARQQYHWSCLERQQRLADLGEEAFPGLAPEPEWLSQIRREHEAGVRFKLHPERTRKPREQLKAEHAQVSAFAQRVWFWVENQRLAGSFGAPPEYALARVNKCSGTNPVRNCLLNVRSFGWRSIADPRRWRYPRERLLNSLPLLLWNGEVEEEPGILRHLQTQLHSRAADWSGLVRAYKEIWPDYG